MTLETSARAGDASRFWVASTKPEAALDRSKAGEPC
jgi:hypothetical protein